MPATLELMAKQQTRPVRINPEVAEKVRLIAEWMVDTNHFGDEREVSMGDLFSEWAKPHVNRYLEDAVKHDMKKKQAMLKK